MTKLDFLNMIEDYKHGHITAELMLTAVDLLFQSQYDGKPIVSGSLPSPYQWLKVQKFNIPDGSSYVEAKDISMRQCAAWISEYVQLLRQ